MIAWPAKNMVCDILCRSTRGIGIPGELKLIGKRKFYELQHLIGHSDEVVVIT